LTWAAPLELPSWYPSRPLAVPDANEFVVSSNNRLHYIRFPDGCPTVITAEESSHRLNQYVSAFPNPFSSMVNIGLLSKTNMGLRIFDIDGRLLKKFSLPGADHLQTVFWNGRNEQGQEVTAGIYYLLLDLPGQTIKKKLLLIK